MNNEVTETVEERASKVVSEPTSTDLYRLLIMSRGAGEILLTGHRSPLTLPCVEIAKWERVAENLNTAVLQRYGLLTTCFFELQIATTGTQMRLYEVMDIRETNFALPPNICWYPTDSLSLQVFADEQDYLAIREALQKIASFQNDLEDGPFGRPCWIEEVFRWVKLAAQPYGIHLTGKFRQLNASPTFSLIRFDTDHQALWFKAVGEPNLREFSISAELARLFPRFVPSILGVHTEWHGWLTAEFCGSSLAETSDLTAWKRVAHTLAEFQTASIGQHDSLTRAGCRDLELFHLLASVDPFIETMTEQMEIQEKTPPPRLTKTELHKLGTAIRHILHDLAEFDVPNTIGHLDFNPGNIMCSAERCIFLDWAEGYVGHPFFTLQFLREHAARLRTGDRNLDVAMVNAYETGWNRIIASEKTRLGLRLAPLAALFAYAVGTANWQNQTVAIEPSTSAYLRSLTRRMQEEVKKLEYERDTWRFQL